ncbi:MAG: hypothetical protein V1800_13320 [Candidatus Latescibacterota bacterium]
MGKSSLMMVLGFMVVFGSIQRTLYRKSLDATDNFVAHYERVAARNVANSAMRLALRELTTDSHWSGCSDDPLFGGTYSVAIQDSTVDPSLSSDQLQLISTSQVGEVSGTVRVVVERESQIPSPPAAMGVSGGSVAYDFGGTAFLVDGRDTNPDGTPGPGPDMPGLTVSDSEDSVGAVAALADPAQIVGAGGSPSIGVSTDIPDLSFLGGWYRSRADFDLPGGSYSGVTWGTLESPSIVYIDGDASIAGNSSGAGVLVVEGSLELKGNCEWFGLIVVFGATVTSTEFIGTPSIHGALLTQSGTIVIRGNVSLTYSSYAIQKVRDNLRNANLYQVVSWWE